MSSKFDQKKMLKRWTSLLAAGLISLCCFLPVSLASAMTQTQQGEKEPVEATQGLSEGKQATAKHAPATRRKSNDIWGKDYFPNIELTTSKGEKVRFYDDLIKDKVVAVNFIYTSCGEMCPVETARLKTVSQILGDRMGKDVFFYSITIDPDRDSVAVLDAYSKKFKTGEGWTFLTGDEEDIRLLRKKMGLYISTIDEDERELSDHNVNLVIGNQALGRWVKRSPLENPYVIANQMGNWLHNWKQPRKNRNKYEDAPKLRQITEGEMKFRNMCTSCHVISGGIAKIPNAPQIGPDLFGVGKVRDPQWLTRWLKEPDVMLAEKDPIAVALIEKYQVVMPNFSLSEVDVKNILQFIENETYRLEQVALKQAQTEIPVPTVSSL
ncbi:MAG: electron transporter SenC [Gammaproteobacteria bacterium]|nr:electron transporter SenC [Gammaproteobacteria bacterium]